MKSKLKPTMHVYLAGVLILVFILILFFSTSSNVYEELRVESEINLVLNDGFYNEVKIGEVYFRNENILPTRYKLTRYVLCDFPENQVPRTYLVDYRGGISRAYSQDIFYGGYYYDYIELSSREELKLSLVANMYRYDARLFNEIRDMYLFVSDSRDHRYYDYCSSADKNNAIKQVRIEITQVPLK